MPEYIWPEVFLNSEFSYDPTDLNHKHKAWVDGLVGWANCMAGSKPPKEFGQGMCKIGLVLEGLVLYEELMQYSKKSLNI